MPAFHQTSRDRHRPISDIAEQQSERFTGAAGSEGVALYFFDTRDGDLFIEDDVGQDLPDLEMVKAMAAASLAELARDVLPGSVRRTLVVEVRDEQRAVLEARLVFEAIILVAQGRRA